MKENKTTEKSGEEIYKEYHDKEWGKPMHDDRKFFELLVLEGAQAGLNWITILKKRENYRKAFDNFNIKKVASYDEKKIKELLNNQGIIRNRLKINSAINNAKRMLDIQEEFGSFDKYIWKFVNNKPIKNRYKQMSDVPAKTKISEEMSKALKERGFTFVGPTICYSFMQATGLVNDHLINSKR